MEVYGGVEGHVAVEEGLSQEGDEVTAHGEQDVGEHKGDAGRRAARQDDAHTGGVRDALVVSRKGVVCRGPGPVSSAQAPARGVKRHRFNPWISKIPWRKEWQPTLVFLPGNPPGQRSLVDYSP